MNPYRISPTPGPRTIAMLLVFAALAVGGCTPWATYPSEGAAGISNPEVNPVPQLMAVAVKEVAARDGVKQDVVFNLPPGAPERLYRRVARLIGSNARPMLQPGEKAYHVYKVRVRGGNGEIDVVHHRRDGEPELITVTCKPNILEGYTATSVRTWRYVFEEVPLPDYPHETWEPDRTRRASAPAGE